jgi:mRNA-degrading endonuclease toxin of MazEF toxin-antitoxin module
MGAPARAGADSGGRDTGAQAGDDRVDLATIRGIPTELVLDEDDGMPTRCAVSLDNLGDAWKATLTEHITTIGSIQMRVVCRALNVAVGCGQ